MFLYKVLIFHAIETIQTVPRKIQNPYEAPRLYLFIDSL